MNKNWFLLIILTCFLLFSSVFVSAGKCEDEGNLLCYEGYCNIGDYRCNPNTPPKEYTVPDGQECTFTGSIRNDGCAWQNPATLTIAGNGCNQAVKYYNCNTKYFLATCGPGQVTFSADDSSEFTLSKKCETKKTKCEQEGHILCSEERCNIGDYRCNPEPPPKEYTIPEGQRCTFTGTIRNSGCAWQNPATLTVTGTGCSQYIRYYNCGVKSFSFTCEPGPASISANDSSYITISKKCDPIPSYCGDGKLDADEECELPSTYDNEYCSQSTWTCSGYKFGTRDSKGFCNSGCNCVEDSFSYECVEDECDAECDSDDDCDDGNSRTTDYCKDNCLCAHDEEPSFCGDGDVDPDEECELPSTYDNQFCPQSTETCYGFKLGTRDSKGFCNSYCQCTPDSFSYECVKDKCDAECDSDDDCDDGNSNTNDYCKNNCLCAHDEEPSFCGDGLVDADEDCELPSTYDNNYCPQSTWTCYGFKFGTRDSRGFCNSNCYCIEDSFSYECVEDECDAECDSDDDCDDWDPDTYDYCADNCVCKHDKVPEICGDGVLNTDEDCELPSTYDNKYCSQSTWTCSGYKVGTRDSKGFCNAVCKCIDDSFTYECVEGECDAECDSHDDCDDGDDATTDICKNDCTCVHNYEPFCGNGILDSGEECELPSTSDNNYCCQSTETCYGYKFGTRDSKGFCNSGCVCAPDSFTYSCVEDKCNAECDSNDDCDDDDPGTVDVCKNDCTCKHVDDPYCGNGIIDVGEECEYDDDCLEDYYCNNCECELSDYCGDNEVDPGEECDDGAYNGIGCNPGRDTSCYYCSTNCTLIEKPPGSCGDGNIDYEEQCDAGSDNGNACSPECERTCYYCDENCMVRWERGDACPGGGPPPDSPCCTPYNPTLPPYYYTGGLYTYPRARRTECGNGVTELGEECDNGNSNGVMCNPACESTCTYCSDSCEAVTMTGGDCYRRPRPWDTGMMGHYCENVLLGVLNVYLDNVCGSNNDDVTHLVSASDNMYATQSACGDGYTYIYLNFGDARLAGILNNAGVFLEHKESLVAIWLEYYDRNSWEELCRVPTKRLDDIDGCSLEGVNLHNVSLRLRIKRSGLEHTSFEMLDFAYLNMTYCYSPGVICGNGVIEGSEECDDGNLMNKDGCNQICMLESMYCSDWGECINGERLMTCTYGGEIVTKKKLCGGFSYSTTLLIIVLIILLLFFLFLPYFYFFLGTNKKEKNKDE